MIVYGFGLQVKNSPCEVSTIEEIFILQNLIDHTREKSPGSECILVWHILNRSSKAERK